MSLLDPRRLSTAFTCSDARNSRSFLLSFVHLDSEAAFIGSWSAARAAKGVASRSSDRFGFQTDASVALVRGGTTAGPPGPRLKAPVCLPREVGVCAKPWVVPPLLEFIFNLVLMQNAILIRNDDG